MTGQNDISIKIGEVTLSTANVSKGGIDLNGLSESTKEALSIFDKNNDGKLSAAEINSAIVKFNAADKTYSTTEKNGDKTITTTTHKNGVLDYAELATLNFKISNLAGQNKKEVAEIQETLKELKKITPQQLKEIANEKGLNYQEFQNEINNAIKEAENYLQGKRAAGIIEIKNGAKELQKVIVRENEIKKNGLQETYNENWLKDANGNHYKYNEQTFKFEKINNVEYVAKDGSYRTVNEKGQRIVHGNNTLQVLNQEKKAYKSPDYAAKTAGLKKFGDGYENENDGKLYTWNGKKYIFEETSYLSEITVTITQQK